MVLFQRLFSRLGEDILLLVLLLALVPLWWLNDLDVSALPALVDWRTVAALAGLMVLSRALEDSGYLSALARGLIGRVHSQRQLALMLVWLSALLSALVTNDVALFIVVPLTLSLRSLADLPIGRLVIFEALAVNAGSAASPMGNPQNLFLWQSFDTGFTEFLLAMLPLSAMLMLALSALVLIAFPQNPIGPQRVAATPPPDRLLLRVTMLLYPLFLLATEFAQAIPAALLVLMLFGWRFRSVLRGVDWLLLLVFILMFIDLGLLARVAAIREGVSLLAALPGGDLSAGILLSQLLSNVPATIFLAGFSDDWRTLAWAVSVGGFGLATGSLANLIALRLARQPGLWLDFHIWSLPMLLAGWAGAFWLLRL